MTYTMEEYVSKTNARAVKPGFKYNSGTNDEWLTVDELRKLIIEHVDSDFQP